MKFPKTITMLVCCFALTAHSAYAINADDLIGTDWKCTSSGGGWLDGGYSYISFGPDGGGVYTNNQGDKSNISWKMTGKNIKISINGGYYIIEGKLSNNKFFSGIGKSQNGKSINEQCKLQ